MTPYELARLALRPALPALHRQAYLEARRCAAEVPGRPRVLDVGGRRSPYTIGLAADVVVSDLPRTSDVQRQLDLGLTDTISARTKRHRSNIQDVVLDDMTATGLPAQSFDLVLAIEVLEHVDLDNDFVANVATVLRPTGTFIMTTPNGDSVANNNPDHVRHYTRDELDSVLRAAFDDVRVRYAIRTSAARTKGLRSFSLRRPFRTAATMICNVISSVESASASLDNMPVGTHNLIAVCRSPRPRLDPFEG